MAPAGAIKPLFGTNPISFAWPRKGKTPVVYDMATASMAMGEVQVAKREGHKVPLGTGLTKDGKETTDPAEIVDGGVLLPFGGYKGSGIAMMVELLAGALVGDNFSYETAYKKCMQKLLGSFIIKSERISDVSSSHPLVKRVFLAKSYISFNDKVTVVINYLCLVFKSFLRSSWSPTAIWCLLLTTYLSSKGINNSGTNPPRTIPIAADLKLGSSVAAI